MSKHILFSLVFSSCLVFVSCGSDKPGTETPTTPIVPKTTFEDVLKATKSEYKEDPAFQVCMADSSTRCVNSVIQNRAMKDHQEDLCSDIVNTDYRDSCLF